MKLDAVFSVLIFSLHGFVSADSNLPAPGTNLQAEPPVKQGHGPDTLTTHLTKIESVHLSKTKSVDLPKKSETHNPPKVTEPTGLEDPHPPKSTHISQSKKSDTVKSKSLDLPKRSETQHPHTTLSTRHGAADAPRSAHTVESKKSDQTKSSSLHRTISERTAPSGFTTHHRVTVSSTSRAASHSQTKGNSDLAGGIIVRLQLLCIFFSYW
jgi:hypothetical protein